MFKYVHLSIWQSAQKYIRQLSSKYVQCLWIPSKINSIRALKTVMMMSFQTPGTQIACLSEI